MAGIFMRHPVERFLDKLRCAAEMTRGDAIAREVLIGHFALARRLTLMSALPIEEGHAALRVPVLEGDIFVQLEAEAGGFRQLD